MGADSDTDISTLAFRLGTSWAVLAVILLSMQGLDRPLWLDEGYTVRIVRMDSVTEMVAAPRSDTHPPVHYVLLSLWRRIYDADWFLRLFAMLTTVPALLLTAFWLRPISRKGALIAIWLLAASPLFLRFTLELRSYGMMISLSALAMLAASRIVACPVRKSSFVLLAVALSFAVVTHLSAVFLAGAVGIYLAVELSRSSSEVPLRGLSAVAVVFIVAFATVCFAYLDIPGRVTGSDWWMPPVTGGLVEKTLASFLGFAPRADNVVSTWPWVGSFCGVAAWLGLAYDRRRYFSLALAVLGYWAVLILYSLLATNLFWYRNLLPALPLMVAWLGLRVAAYPRLVGKWVLTCMVLGWAAVMVVHWPARARKPVEESLAVANAIRSHWTTDSALAAHPPWALGAIDLYLGERERKASIRLSDCSVSSLAIKNRDNTPVSNAEVFHLVVRAEMNETLSVELDRIVATLSDCTSRADSRLHLIVVSSHDLFFAPWFAHAEQLVQVVRARLGEALVEKRSPGFDEAIFRLAAD